MSEFVIFFLFIVNFLRFVYFYQQIAQICQRVDLIKINSMMNNLSAKRQKMLRDFRNSGVRAIMEKIRYEILYAQDQQILNEIISIPNQSMNVDKFQILMDYSKRDFTNAILHIGNLFIDGVINAQFLENLQWSIGTNQHWAWLFNVFSTEGFCTLQMFEYCVKKVITRKSVFSFLNALEVIKKAIKKNPKEIIEFIANDKVLLPTLVNLTHDADEKASGLAFSIISSIVCYSDDTPKFMVQFLGEVRILKMLLNGLTKIQGNSKILTIQIANNFLLCGISFEPVTDRILCLTLKEKEHIKHEISFFWLTFSETIEMKTMLDYVYNKNLLQILKSYAIIHSKGTDKYDEDIRKNSLKAMVYIAKRYEKERGHPQPIIAEIESMGILKQVADSMDEMLEEDETLGIHQ